MTRHRGGSCSWREHLFSRVSGDDDDDATTTIAYERTNEPLDQVTNQLRPLSIPSTTMKSAFSALFCFLSFAGKSSRYEFTIRAVPDGNWVDESLSNSIKFLDSIDSIDRPANTFPRDRELPQCSTLGKELLISVSRADIDPRG